MIYFKNSQGKVFAYPKIDIEQTARLSELELLIQNKEPEFIQAYKHQHGVMMSLNEAKESLGALTFNELNDANNNDVISKKDEKIQQVKLIIEGRAAELDAATIEFNQVDSDYQSLKAEYDAILPIFFNIRESLMFMKKMTEKEVYAYLNPPIPKEQLVTYAEQLKQSLIAEASVAIAPLQDAVGMGIATEIEKARLTTWKIYRVDLNRIDTSLAPDIEWPQKP
ncbi:tail fiber assembly protein [Providencia rettgeri]|uniref:tail fiber assembly protein n=1 Tax=Providencia rettgeri TaxID=587 RepID=UPI0023AA6143|nr:tail fiber assembly protein [Providencia rettgeri]